MAETFETSIPRFVDRLAKLSMEDVALSKNRDKFIQEEIREKVKIGNRLLENNMYTKAFFDKAIKDRRRELAEEASPLGARSGRATMKDGGKFPDLTGDGKVTRADILKGRGVFQDGGDAQKQMEMMLGGVEKVEEPMVPDEQMEENYVDFVIQETLSNQDRNYLIDALEKDDRLSEIFDEVIESATEFTGSGTVEGPGTGRSDSIPARLSDGEFVFTAKATKQLGSDNLMSLMKNAEREADEERQQAQDGGLMEEEETVTMPVERQPVQQDIRVQKETVGAQAAMQEQSDLVDDELKKSMLSTRPYVRS